jgi:hypothetical protein
MFYIHYDEESGRYAVCDADDPDREPVWTPEVNNNGKAMFSRDGLQFSEWLEGLLEFINEE